MADLDYYAMTNEAIAAELGERLKQLRLRQNLSQEKVHERTLYALGTIKNAEKGKVKLPILIGLLREYKALEALDVFIPETGPSPLQLARMAGKRRQKAGSQRPTGKGRKK